MQTCEYSLLSVANVNRQMLPTRRSIRFSRANYAVCDEELRCQHHIFSGTNPDSNILDSISLTDAGSSGRERASIEFWLIKHLAESGSYWYSHDTRWCPSCCGYTWLSHHCNIKFDFMSRYICVQSRYKNFTSVFWRWTQWLLKKKLAQFSIPIRKSEVI